MRIGLITNLKAYEGTTDYYRLSLPAAFLQRLGHFVEPAKAGGRYDIIVMQRNFLPGISEACEKIQAAGIKIVYDIDDALWLLDETHPDKGSFVQPREAVLELLSYADLVTVSTEGMQKELCLLTTKRIVVLKNSMDLSLYQLRKGNNEKLRIGYAGSSSHLPDLEIILPVIEDLQTRYDFDFVLMGFTKLGSLSEYFKKIKAQCNSLVAANVKRIQKHLENIQYEWHPWREMAEYPRNLAELNLDIGLCPLRDSRFNRCKSAQKLYEFSLVGTTVLASDIPPYSGEALYTAKNRFDKWSHKLERLICDESMRMRLAQEQRAWVMANRDMEKNVMDWESAYLSLLERN